MAGVIIANRFWEGSEPVMVLGGAAGLALSALSLKLLSPRPAASRACGATAVSVNDPEDVRAMNEGGICPKAAAWSSSG